MYKIKKLVLLSQVCLTANVLIFTPTYCFSEGEPQLGRLPDGRAFRTDEEGNQLVDYIAELEVENASLKRQVIGLEDDNKNKQDSIESFKRSGAVEPKVQERDLGAVSISPKLPSAKPQPVAAVECQPKIIEKVVEKIVEKPSACLPVKDSKQDGQEKEIQSLKDQIVRAKEELEQKDMDIAILNKKLESKSSTQVAAVAKPPTSFSSFQGNSRTDLSDTRYRAVDMLRKNMVQDLRSFGDLVNHRDKLYAKVDKSKFNKPEEVSIPDLKNRLETSEQIQDLAKVRTEISESRGRVQQEIALYKRELKIR